MISYRITAIALVGSAGICLLLGTAANAAKPAKTQVCHAPPGNPANIQIIEVGSKGNAVTAHILHGDWEVTAPMCDTIPDNDCDGIPDDSAATDADCDDNNANTTDTCNTAAGMCVNEPIVACPCDFDAVLSAYVADGGDLNQPWNRCALEFPGITQSLHNTVKTMPDYTAQLSLSAFELDAGGFGCQASAIRIVPPPSAFITPTIAVRPISEDEFNACGVKLLTACSP